MAASSTTAVQYHRYCVCLKEKTHSGPARACSLPPNLVLGLHFDVILSVNATSSKEKITSPTFSIQNLLFMKLVPFSSATMQKSQA